MDWLKEMYEEHGAVLGMLGLLDAYSKNLRAGKGGKLDEILELADTFIERCHHGKEEKALFPLLAAGTPGGRQVVDGLIRDHAEGKRLVGLIRNGTDEEKFLSIKGYDALVRAHIARENRFFREGDALLKTGEKEQIAAGFGEIDLEVLGNAGRAGVVERIRKLKAGLG
jgi:hemerythrin-like domain-containing protein